MEEKNRPISNPAQPSAALENTFAPPSEFRGRTIQLIGWQLLGVLLSLITLGIGAPWAYCMVIRWETKHTYVNGKRLFFDGKGHQLLGRWLLWGLLTLITLGIYALFIPVRMSKWRASQTRFAKPNEGLEGPSGGLIFGCVMAVVAAAALIALVIVLLTQDRPAEPVTTDEPGSLWDGFQDGFQFSIDENGDYVVVIPDGQEDLAVTPGGQDTITVSPGGETSAAPTESSPASLSILGSWLLCSPGTEPLIPPDAALFTFYEDGTFRHERGLYDFIDGKWYYSSLSHSDYKGTYTLREGTLTLHYTQTLYAPYTSEPGEWVSMDSTETQNITLSADGSVLYFSDPDAFCDDYHKPIEGLRKGTGSICDILDQHFPNGIQ